MILNEARADPKWQPKAKSLYDNAMKTGWDKECGGIVYVIAPDESICGGEKHFWVQSESFATAWRLFYATGDDKYLQDFKRIWRWSWEHLGDHNRVRVRDDSAIDNKKSPLGKTDYHTMGACWDVLSVSETTNLTPSP